MTAKPLSNHLLRTRIPMTGRVSLQQWIHHAHSEMTHRETGFWKTNDANGHLNNQHLFPVVSKMLYPFLNFLVQTPGPKKVQLLGPSTSTLTVWPHWRFFWSGLKRAGWLTWCPVWAAFCLKSSVKNVFCDMPMCISTEQACTKWMLSSGYPAFYL